MRRGCTRNEAFVSFEQRREVPVRLHVGRTKLFTEVTGVRCRGQRAINSRVPRIGGLWNACRIKKSVGPFTIRPTAAILEASKMCGAEGKRAIVLEVHAPGDLLFVRHSEAEADFRCDCARARRQRGCVDHSIVASRPVLKSYVDPHDCLRVPHAAFVFLPC